LIWQWELNPRLPAEALAQAGPFSVWGKCGEKHFLRRDAETAPGSFQGIVRVFDVLALGKLNFWKAASPPPFEKKITRLSADLFREDGFFYFLPLFSDGLCLFHIFLKYLFAHCFFSAFLPLFGMGLLHGCRLT